MHSNTVRTSSPSTCTGGISYECHDLLFFEELNALVDKEIENEKNIGTATEDSASIKEMTAEDDNEATPVIKRLERRVIDKHVRTGRLRRVLSSSEALARRNGHDHENLPTGTQTTRAILSFNDALLPLKRRKRLSSTGTPNATFGGNQSSSEGYRRNNAPTASARHAMHDAPPARAAAGTSPHALLISMSSNTIKNSKNKFVTSFPNTLRRDVCRSRQECKKVAKSA